MKVKEIDVLEGYCPDTNIPCERCPYYDKKKKRCTHPPISISLILRDGDGNEVTITLPYMVAKVTIAGEPKL